MQAVEDRIFASPPIFEPFPGPKDGPISAAPVEVEKMYVGGASKYVSISNKTTLLGSDPYGKVAGLGERAAFPPTYRQNIVGHTPNFSSHSAVPNNVAPTMPPTPTLS